MKALPVALLAGLLAAGPLLAAEDDFLDATGKLSSEDFYRLVACRALPGGPCTVEPVRWPPERARDLVVSVRTPPLGYPPGAADRAARAIDTAIAEINAAGADLRLRRDDKAPAPDVAVHLARVREGDTITGTGIWGVDGQTLGAALVTVWWDERQDLTEAVIVVAEDLPADEVGPVLLEELTQAMGLMTDIRDPYYDRLSVFAEDSNSVTKLGPQDREALRRHYPPGAP